MTVFLGKSKTTYYPYEFKNEKEFEKLVVDMADQIFGSSSIYIDVKKQMKKDDIINIPDGYLIDLLNPRSPRLFVIENEISKHHPFKHIGIQLLKFSVSFEDSRKSIRDFLMMEIHKSESAMEKLQQAVADSDFRNIDNLLDAAVYSDFKAIVIIDEAQSNLYNVIEKIRASISVIELKAFESEDGDKVFQFDPFNEEDIAKFEDESDEDSRDIRLKRKQRHALCDTIVVPAQEEGFNRVFIGEHQWYAIRIGAAMRERIKFIAAYQVAPISAVTHIAEIDEIVPYKDSGKFLIKFKGPAQSIKAIPLKTGKNGPQGPVYVQKDKLLSAKFVDDAFRLVA